MNIMKATVSRLVVLILVGCGGSAGSVGGLDREQDDGGAEASSDASHVETGPTCTTTQSPITMSYDGVGCFPYGPTTYPAAYVVNFTDVVGMCDDVTTPSACSCAETYNCACLMTQPGAWSKTSLCTTGYPTLVRCSDSVGGSPIVVVCGR